VRADESKVHYWSYRCALALLPPMIGYLILFGLIPWIGRGFRSTQVQDMTR
jgi:hypothetical protein